MPSLKILLVIWEQRGPAIFVSKDMLKAHPNRVSSLIVTDVAADETICEHKQVLPLGSALSPGFSNSYGKEINCKKKSASVSAAELCVICSSVSQWEMLLINWK